MSAICQVATAEPEGGILIATYTFLDVPRAGDDIELPAGPVQGQGRSYTVRRVLFISEEVTGSVPRVTLFVDGRHPV